MFFKIESWNFQHLFEKLFHQISKNLNSIRQSIEKFKITIVWMSWMSWNFMRFHEIQFLTDTERFSFQSWKTKKVLFLKKDFLSRCQYQNKKTVFTGSIFREGFDTYKLQMPFVPFIDRSFPQVNSWKMRSLRRQFSERRA